jgi:hypothetical protein
MGRTAANKSVSADEEQSIGPAGTGMRTVFSTSDVRARDRFDYWRDVTSQMLVNYHTVEPVDRRAFSAEMVAGDLAKMGIVVLDSSPIKFETTTSHIRKTLSDNLFLCVHLAGKLVLEQDARHVTLKDGDMTLIDPLLPYSANYMGHPKRLVLKKIPRRSLEARVGNIRGVAVRRLDATTAEARLGSTFFRMLPAHVGQLSRSRKN